MEQKPKEVLVIEPPNELRFVGPFNRPVVTIIKLKNPSDNMILFKIKTTAPKRYCVRPNFGSIAPHMSATVEICLQPFVYDPYEKNKHKFMVQSLIAPEESEDWAKLWKESEALLMDTKLKCVFEMPAESTNVEATRSVTSAATKDVSPKALSEEKISNLPPSEQSDMVMNEIRQVREENSELRKENLNLKEQVMRLRCSTVKPPMDEPYAPMAEKQIPIFYIAIAILLAFIGLLLGKFFL